MLRIVVLRIVALRIAVPRIGRAQPAATNQPVCACTRPVCLLVCLLMLCMLWYATLRYAMLCHAMLCFGRTHDMLTCVRACVHACVPACLLARLFILCRAVPSRAVLCYARTPDTIACLLACLLILGDAMLCYAMLCHAMLGCLIGLFACLLMLCFATPGQATLNYTYGTLWHQARYGMLCCAVLFYSGWREGGHHGHDAV